MAKGRSIVNLPAVTQTESPFKHLPLLVAERIFDNLNVSTIQKCRLVCTKWYLAIMSLYTRPNGFCIRTKRWTWNSGRQLENSANEGFTMKDYEDPFSPVQNLKLENVDISDCLNLLEKSPDFRHTVDHTTHLNLTNAFFRDCDTFILFLSKFKKLKKLGIIQGNFSSLEVLSVFHLRWRMKTKFGDAKFPESLKFLYLEVRQDCAALPLLFEMLNEKIENLEEFKICVITFNDGMFQKAIMGVTGHLVLSTIHTSTFFICWLVAKILEKHETKLKTLQVLWELNGTSLPQNQFDIETSPEFRLLVDSFRPYLIPTNELRLNKLILRLGTVSTQSDQLTQTILPFMAMQIRRGCRFVAISTLLSRFIFPQFIYPQLFADFPELEDEEFLANFFDTMKIHIGLKMEQRGSAFTAVNTGYWLAKNYSLQFLERLTIDIIGPSFGANAPEFGQWMPGSNEQTFCSLKKLNVHCTEKQLRNFSFFRIGMRCPYLNTLVIIDGPITNYEKGKMKKEEMSSTKIQDCDLRFIIYKLKHLKSLTIWANMELVTDFAIIGCSNNLNILTYNFVNGHKIKEHFTETVPAVLQNEAKLKTTSCRYDRAVEKIITSSISKLKHLNKLSLRGVGSSITDRIISSFLSADGACCFQKLEILEIIGWHQITKIGGENLKKRIKEVNL